MAISEKAAEAIKKMVIEDPELCERLRATESRQELAHGLAVAASEKGIEVDEADLDAALEIVFQQYSGEAELSDEMLEGVTGGVAVTTVLGIAALSVAVGVIGGLILQQFVNKYTS